MFSTRYSHPNNLTLTFLYNTSFSSKTSCSNDSFQFEIFWKFLLALHCDQKKQNEIKLKTINLEKNLKDATLLWKNVLTLNLCIVNGISEKRLLAFLGKKYVQKTLPLKVFQ